MLRRHRLDERLRQRRSVRARRIWQHEVRQRPVELQPLEIGVEGCARDAGSFGIRPERLQPRSEALLDGAAIGGDLRVVGGRSGERRKHHRRQEGGQHGCTSPVRLAHRRSPPKSRDSAEAADCGRRLLAAKRQGQRFFAENVWRSRCCNSTPAVGKSAAAPKRGVTARGSEWLLPFARPCFPSQG